MKRVRVPDGAVKAYEAAAVDEYHMIHDYRKGLEAAFQFISEHPQLPTRLQVEEFISPEMSPLDPYDFSIEICRRWQSRCFVQEEPEIPAEIEDLLKSWEGGNKQNLMQRDLIDAYRRGLRKGEQK